MPNMVAIFISAGLLSAIHLGLLFLVSKGSYRYGYKTGAKDAAKAIQSQINEAYKSHQAKQPASEA